MSEIKNNQQLPYIIIIALLVVIAVLAFFLWRNQGGNGVVQTPKNIEITVVDDQRCADCNTSQLIDQLKQLPSLTAAKIDVIDFSDKEAEALLTKNGITKLPAILFNTNNVGDSSISQYLEATSDGKYNLNIGAKFNPYAKRSDRGFLVMDLNSEDIKSILTTGHIKGNKNADITWLEYTDLQCPYCAQQANSGLDGNLFAKYGEKLNKIIQQFPLSSIHPFAFAGSEISECVADQKWDEVFYKLVERTFAKFQWNNLTIDGMKKLAVDEFGVNAKDLDACVSSHTFQDRVTQEQSKGDALFGITGTPGNILINNKTWEYEILAGAYPEDSFVQAIDRLLAN